MKMSEHSEDQPNMSCEQVESQLVAYAKKDVPVAEQQAIAAHLASCDACALSLQQLDMIEADLYAEATQYQPHLSLEASQRIQEQVYRRMRLSLVWQRLFQSAKMGLAVASMAIFLVVASLFAYQWFLFLANPEPVPGSGVVITAVSVESEPILVETAVFQPEILPTAIPEPIEPIELVPSPIEPNLIVESDVPFYWQNLSSLTVGEAPVTIAKQIVTSALNNEQSELNGLMAAMTTVKEPNVRLWLLFNRRCYGTMAAADFEYVQASRHQLPITAVYLYHNDRYTGEIKFRRINGEWFAVFSHPPTINACLKARLTLPFQ